MRGVESGSPAEKAGVQPGDIITKFNGSTIARTSDLPRLVGETKPGTEATITVLRNGSSKDLAITIAKAEDDATPRSLLGQNGEKLPGAAAIKSLGLNVAEISAQQRQQLRGKGGVLVQEVEAGSPAERAGLAQGEGRIYTQAGRLVATYSVQVMVRALIGAENGMKDDRLM